MEAPLVEAVEVELEAKQRAWQQGSEGRSLQRTGSQGNSSFEPRRSLRRSSVERLVPTSVRVPQAIIQWPALDAPGTLSTLGLQKDTIDTGLNIDQARSRLARFGRNVLQAPAPKSFCKRCLDALFSATNAFLLVSAAVSWPIGRHDNSIILFFSVVLGAVVSALGQSPAVAASKAILKEQADTAKCLRSGAWVFLPAAELVPGDIVEVSLGERCPADLRVVDCCDLLVVESSFTGEASEVEKHSAMEEVDELGSPAKNMLYAYSDIVAGRATGIVVATGMSTRIGQISRNVQDVDVENPASASSLGGPMQVAMDSLSYQLTVACGLALVVSLCLCRWNEQQDVENLCPEGPGRSQCLWLTAMQFALLIAVKVIPNLLVPACILCLKVASGRMQHRHIDIRKLGAVEALGACSVVCTDKTGTLTEGCMTAVQLFVSLPSAFTFDLSAAKEADRDISAGHTDNFTSWSSLEAEFARVAMKLALLNCFGVAVSDHKSKRIVKGNTTEAALVKAALQIDQNVENIWEQLPLALEVPFSSSRKVRATVHTLSEQNPSTALRCLALAPSATHVAVLKGAAEKFAGKIRFGFHLKDGDSPTWLIRENEGDEMLRLAEEKQNELAGAGLRIIMCACRPLTAVQFKELEAIEDIESRLTYILNDLTFASMIALEDPPRTGVRNSVDTCLDAGIRVVMITGDQLLTAKAIAQAVGIKGPAMMTSALRLPGGRLRDNIMDLISQVSIWARATPEDKIVIVEALQAQGRNCAMTGDGVNDAAALRQADIGVAMGSGSAVARGAADIVLLNDNFAGIVEAIAEGRRTFSNIGRIIGYWLTLSISGVTSDLILIFFKVPLAWGIISGHVLAFSTVTLGWLPLCWEPADRNSMLLPPRPKEVSILPHATWRFVMLPMWFMLPVVSLIHAGFFLWLQTGCVQTNAVETLCDFAWHVEDDASKDGRVILQRDGSPYHCKCPLVDQWGRKQTPDNNLAAQFNPYTGHSGKAYLQHLGPFAENLTDYPLKSCSISTDGSEESRELVSCWTEPWASETGMIYGLDGTIQRSGRIAENLQLDPKRNCAHWGFRIGKTMAWFATLLSHVFWLQTTRSNEALPVTFFRNRTAVMLCVISILIGLCVIYIPGINDAVELSPIRFGNFCLVLIGPFCVVFVAECCKTMNSDFKALCRVNMEDP